MVDVEKLSKRFGRGRGGVLALERVNLTVEDGEFVSLLGPSGCGKSTLLRIIAGLVTASAGTVAVAGATVSGPSNNIGMAFQSPALLPWRSVLGNIELPVEVKGLS